VNSILGCVASVFSQHEIEKLSIYVIHYGLDCIGVLSQNLRILAHAKFLNSFSLKKYCSVIVYISLTISHVLHSAIHWQEHQYHHNSFVKP
jgi:hypothetical protein